MKLLPHARNIHELISIIIWSTRVYIYFYISFNIMQLKLLNIARRDKCYPVKWALTPSMKHFSTLEISLLISLVLLFTTFNILLEICVDIAIF